MALEPQDAPILPIPPQRRIEAHDAARWHEEQLPHAGVVWLESITPATGAVDIDANRTIVARIGCLADLDTSLVTITVNGVTCTVANSGLDFWQTVDVYGGAVHADLSDVYFATLHDYNPQELESITATVAYHGDTIGSTTFTTVSVEDFDGQGDAYFEAVESSDIRSSYDVQFMCWELSRDVAADCYWYAAELMLKRFPASGLAGELLLDRFPASALVQGWLPQRFPVSGLVQGWHLARFVASGVTAVQFYYRNMISGLVGVEFLDRFPASAVVYGVNRNNVMDVHVLDEATYTALTAEGITWS